MRRWLTIIFRTVHLAGVAGIGGGYLWNAPVSDWEPWLWLTVASGLALVTTDIWGDWRWWVQVRGVAVIAKLALLGVIPAFPGQRGALFLAAVGVSAVISHAPRHWRHFSLVGERGRDPRDRERRGANDEI